MPTSTYLRRFGVLAVMLLCACLVRRAAADDITIANLTAISGAPGDTITVYGDLTNNTGDALYFSDDAINLSVDGSVASASDDLIVNAFLGFGPTEVDPGSPLTGVDLFTIQLSGGSGFYTGNTFDLYGGDDYDACSAGTDGCDNQLGGAVFTFDVTGGSNPQITPEPEPWLLLATGVLAVLWWRRRTGPDVERD